MPPVVRPGIRNEVEVKERSLTSSAYPMSGEGINLLCFHRKAVWTSLCGRLLPEQRLDFAKQAVKFNRFGIVIVTSGSEGF